MFNALVKQGHLLAEWIVNLTERLCGKLSWSRKKAEKQATVHRRSASESDRMSAARSAAGPSNSKNDQVDLYSDLYPSDEVSPPSPFFKEKLMVASVLIY